MDFSEMKSIMDNEESIVEIGVKKIEDELIDY